MNRDPFSNFSVKLKPVKRDFLDADELKAIEEAEITVPRIDQVRDIFVFSCYTGLAYVDLSLLSKENIKKGIDGEVFNVVDDDLPTSREFLKMYKRNTGHFKSIYIPYRIFYFLCYQTAYQSL